MLIFRLSHPEGFGWFESTLLGYRTKLAVLLAIAFVLGNTITAFVNMCAGAAGGVYGAIKGYKPSFYYDIAPWRDPNWRTLVTNKLGASAPQNVMWLSDAVFEARQKAVEFMPEEQRSVALNELVRERMNAVTSDMEWRQWYDYFQRIVSDSRFEGMSRRCERDCTSTFRRRPCMF